MTLNDLIDALAAEIETVQPDLERDLQQLASLEPEDPAFMDALDQYASQAQRMGEAAELAGFPGLQAVCEHVVENTLLMAALPVAERGDLLQFLHGWPPLVVHYLRDLSDPSLAAGLVDHLVQAPSPLDEERALKIAHMLGSMEAQLHAPYGDGAAPRPVLATPADVALEIPEDVDQKLIEGFFTEAPDQARYLVDLARNLASGDGDSSDLVAAKRVVHTLKGSGSIIGLRGLSSLGHHLEDILEHFERSGSQVARPVADALLDAAWCLEQMIGYVLGTDEYPGQAQAVLQTVLDLANRIDRGETLEDPVARVDRSEPVSAPTSDDSAQARTGETGAPPARSARRGAESTVTASPAAALRVSVERVDELFRVAGEISVHTAAMEARMKTLIDGSRALLAQNLRMQKRLFELETVVDVRALTMMRARGNSDAGAYFDPLELDQYNELHSATHALMEEAADARALAGNLEEEIARTASLQARQQRLSRDLQHLVINTRMTEVGVLASRLHRNVRSTCQATGKQAELVIKGGTTLIDSDVLNRLADPLLHVLRNAVDHGLEMPEERLAAGKPASGTIVLSFTRQGQQVVMRCQDDGRGLDYPAIRARAIERGLISPTQVVSDEELARLILMSGFSTRHTINELSGRGVGLDVVREWASSTSGSIRVASRPGEGCTLELRFPASLSTMQSLIVEAAGQRFALPSVQVERAVSRGVGSFERLGDKLVYRLDRFVHPALMLAELTGLPAVDGPVNDFASFDAVLVRVDDRVHALAVEGLIDSRELLVKNPGRYARHVRGVAGLSILGDGSVAVNLDLSQLFEGGGSAARGASRLPAAADPVPHGAPTGDEPAGSSTGRTRSPLAVLIVDDALSVRNALQQVMQDAGFRTETARDGIEAISALAEFEPDVVLTDLEMPNMNGLELTTHIRGRDDLKELPVIMITSRSQDKHRRMAERAGVDSYVTKPYNEIELLDTIRALLAARGCVRS